MSPGKKALREAARLEAARIYGKLCPEPPRVATETTQGSVGAQPNPVRVVQPKSPGVATVSELRRQYRERTA